MKCTIAEENTNGRYYCTRGAGHRGPCAAVPASDPVNPEHDELLEARAELVKEIERQLTVMSGYLPDDICKACGHRQHGIAGCSRTMNKHLLYSKIDELVDAALLRK